MSVEESYYNCTIVDPKDMDYYKNLDSSERSKILFAMFYESAEYDGERDKRNEYLHWYEDDMPYLVY